MRMLVVGDDKICRTMLNSNPPPSDVRVVVDQSSDMKRVLTLIRNGSLTIPLIARMALADARRADGPPISGERVKSNAELFELVQRERPSKIILFRAGIIIRKNLIDTGIPIWNLHSAKLPEYGGIGTIWRALRDGAVDQCATLHIVTEKVDSGKVLDTEPYRLNPKASYAANENTAYAAGTRLLERTLHTS